MRIPTWVFSSPKEIVLAYLKEAYLMEGGVCEPTTGKREIRFHTCDKGVVIDLIRLLKERLQISSVLTTYSVKGYGLKYCISISKISEIKKFAVEIGFDGEPHGSRLKYILDNLPISALESTFALIKRLDKVEFSPSDIANISGFSYSLINWRLKKMIALELCTKWKKNMYILTMKGREAILKINSLNISEKNIIRKRLSHDTILFIRKELQKGKTFSSISRKFGINWSTVRGQVLKKKR